MPDCDGSEYCRASQHIHGCYQERRWPEYSMTVEEANEEAEKCEQYTRCKALAHKLTCPNYNRGV